MATGLGFPAITTPNALDLRAIQTAIGNARQRIEQLERLIAALQTSNGSATTSTPSSVTLNALRAALAALTTRVTALENATATDIGLFTAGEPVSIGTAVVPVNGGAVGPADASDPTHMFALIGIALNSAGVGEQVQVQRRGIYAPPGASGWEIGRAVYVDVGGLTQTPDSEATALPVGVAVSATQLFITPDYPAILSPAYASGFADIYLDYMPVTYRALSALASLQDQINALPAQSGADADMGVPVVVGGIAVRVTAGDIAALAGASADLLALIDALPYSSGAEQNMMVPVTIGGVALRVTAGDIARLAGGAVSLAALIAALPVQSGAEVNGIVPVLLGSTAVQMRIGDILALVNLATLINNLPYSSGAEQNMMVPVTVGGAGVRVNARDIAALVFAASFSSNVDQTALVPVMISGVQVLVYAGDIARLGGGSPAGSTNQIQYNGGGAFAAEAAFAYNPSTNTLTVDNVTMNGLLLTLASATGGAGLRIPHGAAPTTPTNGDMWTTTGGLFARINGATQGPYITSATVTGFVTALFTAAPNNTVNSARLLTNTVSANGDLILSAKASGAIQAELADSTIAGGNKRGLGAVDFMHGGTRTAAGQVASGSNSFQGAGLRNTTSGSSATNVAGEDNNSTGTASFNGAGTNNIVQTGSAGGNVAGNANTVSGTNAFNGAGDNNFATGAGAVTLGRSCNADASDGQAYGVAASSRGIKGYQAFASMQRSGGGLGYNQKGTLTMAVRTANATVTTLTSDGGAAAADNQLIIPAGMASTFRFRVIAYRASNGDFKSWEGVGGVCNFGGTMSNGTTAPSGTGTTGVTATAGAATWAFNANLESVTDFAQQFKVTGQAAADIDWTLVIEESFVRA